MKTHREGVESLDKTITGIRALCRKYTDLSEADIQLIIRTAANLVLVADLAQADIFVDCPTTDPDVAIVVAEAKPRTAPSLYRSSVVGQMALRENEPAVIRTHVTGQPTLATRGVTQEAVPVKQTVVPIKRGGRTIGALIMEQDISQQVRQEQQVEILAETAKQLTETLFQVAMEDRTLPTLMHDGLLILNHDGVVTYANPVAVELFQAAGISRNPVGASFNELSLGVPSMEQMMNDQRFSSAEVQVNDLILLIKAASLLKKDQVIGAIMLIRDITEIRLKEKELMLKSAVIQEIHHRVKNNLQTIASLLRLQLRRAGSADLRKAYSESINRIHSIAVVHEALSREGLDVINIKETMASMLEIISESMVAPHRQIAMGVEGDAILLPSQEATSIALIVNELVQNALDHAFPGTEEGRIVVRLEDKGDQVVIEVTDTGIGVPAQEQLWKTGKLGLYIVKTLIGEHLKGHFSMDNHPGGGARALVDFPKPNQGGESHDPGAHPDRGR